MKISKHFQSRNPSAIRLASIEFAKRADVNEVTAINTAIGNVSLPAHPKLVGRLDNMRAKGSPMENGQIMYTATVGLKETNDAVLNIIAASGFDTTKLYSQITNGGSQAMEYILLGTCESGDAAPVLLIDAAYTNYKAMAQRIKINTVSISRNLGIDGKFSLPNISEIEKVIEEHHPGAMVVIPYDNPTGQFYDHKTMIELGKLCVKYDMAMVSDEAYRELFYVNHDVVSIWGLTNAEVPGIEGNRISIETASKVWNACGLRIGAMVTDNKEYFEKSVNEGTADLCSPTPSQYIFGALAHESKEDLQAWFKKQRDYYFGMMNKATIELKEELPGVIVSSPDASIYSVVDVKNIAKQGFDAKEFVLFCAQEGRIPMDDENYTLLVAPMAGFYSARGENNPGNTQMRIAYVPTPEEMKKVPKLFAELFRQYEAKRD